MSVRVVKGYYGSFPMSEVSKENRPFAKLGFRNKEEAIKYLKNDLTRDLHEAIDEDLEHTDEPHKYQFTQDDIDDMFFTARRICTEKRRRDRAVKRLLNKC